MPNWRAHALEPFLTAAIVIGVVLIAWVAMLLASGGIDYLPIALFLGFFYPLIVAVPWVAFTAVFSWLLRRQSHWISLAAGGFASILLAGLALAPVIANTFASNAGNNADRVSIAVFAIGAILAISLVQFFVHIGLRARRRGETAPELG